MGFKLTRPSRSLPREGTGVPPSLSALAAGARVLAALQESCSLDYVRVHRVRAPRIADECGRGTTPRAQVAACASDALSTTLVRSQRNSTCLKEG